MKSRGSDARHPAEDDDVVDEILDWIASGQALDVDHLKSRFPGYEARIERLCRGAGPYSVLMQPRRREVGPGTVLGDFLVESLLARGGMGAVYRARQRSLGNRVVALKVLPAEGVSETASARFRREALLAASLHHPNLAEVYGFGQARGYFYYAMRLVEGPTLQDTLAHVAGEPSPFREHEVLRILVSRIAEAAAGLSAVHAAGLVHRDVKPGNIVLQGGEANQPLSSASEAVLVDFGLVRPVDVEVRTRPEESLITPAYASPEQALGQDLDARTDVFSLGVTLHDLLTRRLPCERSRASAGIEALGELASGIDPDLSAVVAKAVESDVRWRYKDAASLKSDLDAWLAGEPVSARRLHGFERTIRWGRRNAWRILSLSARALATVVLLGITLAIAVPLWAAKRDVDRSNGELGQFGNTLASLHPIVAYLILDSDERALAARLRRLESDPPTIGSDDAVEAAADVYRRIQQGKTADARLQAACYLQRDGLGKHPWLVPFLLASLGTEDRASRSHTLELVARLFYERPDLSPTDAGLSHRFREYLLAVVDGDASSDDLDERLHAWMALAGCGSVSQIPQILERIESYQTGSEIHRLAIKAMEWIIGRARACGQASGIDETVAQRLLARGRKGVLDGTMVWQSLLVTFGLFERCRGGWIDPKDLPLSSIHVFERLVLLALFDSERFDGELESVEDIGSIANLAAWCAIRFEGNAEAQRQCILAKLGRSQLDVRQTESVERTIRDWAEKLEYGGWSSVLLPHHSSQLRRAFERPGGRRFLQTRSGGPLAGQVIGDSLAAWSFRSATVEVWGEAGGVEVVGDAEHASGESPPHWRLLDIGRSSIHLTFNVPDEKADRPYGVTIKDYAPSRQWVPYLGVARVDVSIDGYPLARDRAVYNASFYESFNRYSLEATTLPPGEHRLAIHLVGGTATYGLLDVRIERGIESRE